MIDRRNYTSPSSSSATWPGGREDLATRGDHVPPWVMAPQEGGDFNAFPDLPPARPPSDLSERRRGGQAAAEAARALRARSASTASWPR